MKKGPSNHKKVDCPYLCNEWANHGQGGSKNYSAGIFLIDKLAELHAKTTAKQDLPGPTNHEKN